MAQYTPNLGLIKPDGSDNVAIQQLNANMDVLDEQVHENTEKIDRIRIMYPPYIDENTGHWMIYDPDTGDYADSGYSAIGRPATFTARATTLPAGSDATASMSGTAENPILNLGIPQGDAAGFAAPTASVDANVGTPSVTVTATGPDTAKQFSFEFHNLKGEDGTIGYTPSIGIGTVQSVPTGESAEVTRTGTDTNPVLNFKLPRSGDGVGLYPVSIPIAVAEWVEESGVYKYTLSDATIKSYMTVLESWLDDEAVQLGKVWYTVNNGSLVVNTDVVPTAAWSLHVTLGTDGTDVLEDVADLESRFPVSIADGGTGGTTAATARQALGITGENIPTSVISGETNVDGALGSISQQISNVQKGLAYIVGNTNTTGSTLANGAFVYVKGHSTITEGLRKVTATNGISLDGSITTNNTAPCSEGGLNALNSKMKTQEIKADRFSIDLYGSSDYSFDKPNKQVMRLNSNCSGTNPNSVIGGNQWLVFTLVPDTNGTERYNGQIAFGFGSDGAIACRRKNNSTTWDDWKKFAFAT